MSAASDSLILDLLDWLAERPKPYAEVMDAWRTSCPRLTIWEDAVDRGFVRVMNTKSVCVTDVGRAFQQANRPQRAG